MNLSLKRVDPEDFPLPQFSNDIDLSFLDKLFFILDSLGMTNLIIRRWVWVPYTLPNDPSSNDSESLDDDGYVDLSTYSDNDEVELDSLSRTVRRTPRTDTYTSCKTQSCKQKTYYVRTDTQAHFVPVVKETHLSEEDVAKDHVSEEDVDGSGARSALQPEPVGGPTPAHPEGADTPKPNLRGSTTGEYSAMKVKNSVRPITQQRAQDGLHNLMMTPLHHYERITLR